MFCHSLKPTCIVITTEHTWMEKCTKFGQSIHSKIIKIVATSYQILRLICTNFNFGWGSAPDPAGGAHSAPPDFLAGFKGPTSKGRGGGQGRGEKMERGEGREGEGVGENGRERKEEGIGKKMREGRRKVCLLLNGGLVTPLVATIARW